MSGSIFNISIDVDLNDVPAVPRARPMRRGERRDQFSFDFCKKSVRLGDQEIEQWWLPHQGLYGDRKRASRNYRSIIDCYWQLCLRERASTDPESRQTYVLASLLPDARSNCSRKVFADASFREINDHAARHESICELDRMIDVDRGTPMLPLDFHQRTQDILGPPNYGEEVFACYEQMQDEILGDCNNVDKHFDTASLNKVTEAWKRKMNGIGRRAGNQVPKQALDILSYECRTSFHQCYSSVWSMVLLDTLAESYGLTDTWRRFHSVWHLDQLAPNITTPSGAAHLFHGHILGLHPGPGNLLRGSAGRELVGEWLSSPDDVRNWYRLLNGIYIACYDYAIRYDVAKALNKRQPELTIDGDIESIAADW